MAQIRRLIPVKSGFCPPDSDHCVWARFVAPDIVLVTAEGDTPDGFKTRQTSFKEQEWNEFIFELKLWRCNVPDGTWRTFLGDLTILLTRPELDVFHKGVVAGQFDFQALALAASHSTVTVP